MRPMHTRTDGKRGYTLLEIAISLSILMMVLGSVVGLGKRGVSGYEQRLCESALLARATRSSERVLDLLVGASSLSMEPNDPVAPWGCDALEVRGALDWNGDVEWGAETRIAFELEENELDNDVDDDGDGRIDEGIVVVVEDVGGPGERRRTVARGVRRLLEGEIRNGLDDNGNGLIDESGLSFELVGDVLVVRLTLEIEGPDRRDLVKTFQTSVHLRN